MFTHWTYVTFTLHLFHHTSIWIYLVVEKTAKIRLFIWYSYQYTTFVIYHIGRVADSSEFWCKIHFQFIWEGGYRNVLCESRILPQIFFLVACQLSGIFSIFSLQPPGIIFTRRLWLSRRFYLHFIIWLLKRIFWDVGKLDPTSM